MQAELTDTIDFTGVIKNTIAADREAGIALLQEIDKTKKDLEAKKEKEAAAKKEIAEQQKLQDLRQKEVEKLEEQIILLQKGAEAAHAFRLEKQGLSKSDAAAIAKVQRNIDLAKPKEIPDIQAFESRLLTRGSSTDKTDLIAKNTESMAAEQKKVVEYLKLISQNVKPALSPNTMLRLVT